MEATFTPLASSSFFGERDRRDALQVKETIRALLTARMLESSDRPTDLGLAARVFTSSCGGFPANLQI